MASIGITTQGANRDAGWPGARGAYKIFNSGTQDFAATSVRCWIQVYSGGGVGRAGIYTSVSNTPTNRVALSSDVSIPANTVSQVTFGLTVTLSASTSYWLAVGFNDVATGIELMADTGGTHVYNLGGGTLPTTFGTATVQGTYSMPIAVYGSYIDPEPPPPPPPTINNRMLLYVG